MSTKIRPPFFSYTYKLCKRFADKGENISSNILWLMKCWEKNLCDIKIYFYSIKINLHSIKFMIYMTSKMFFGPASARSYKIGVVGNW